MGKEKLMYSRPHERGKTHVYYAGQSTINVEGLDAALHHKPRVDLPQPLDQCSRVRVAVGPEVQGQEARQHLHAQVTASLARNSR